MTRRRRDMKRARRLARRQVLFETAWRTLRATPSLWDDLSAYQPGRPFANYVQLWSLGVLDHVPAIEGRYVLSPMGRLLLARVRLIAAGRASRAG